MEYIINSKKLTQKEYIELLEDLIDLAKRGMPLEVIYIPIGVSDNNQ